MHSATVSNESKSDIAKKLDNTDLQWFQLLGSSWGEGGGVTAHIYMYIFILIYIYVHNPYIHMHIHMPCYSIGVI